MTQQSKHLKIIKHNQLQSHQLQSDFDRILNDASNTIANTDLLINTLLNELNIDKNSPLTTQETSHVPLPLQTVPKDYQTLLIEAEEAWPGPVDTLDVLTPSEYAEVLSDFEKFEKDFNTQHNLDSLDYTAAFISGTIAGIVDLMIVGEATKGAVKSVFSALGAPLAEKNKIGQGAKVSFDHILNKSFGAKGNHRSNSVSHYVGLRGLFSAVQDTLNGTSTHIVNGRIVTVAAATKTFNKAIEGTPLGDPCAAVFFKVVTAIELVLKHWTSDINSPLGLPPPFMLLAQLIKNGEFSDFAKDLYQSGFDFRHFIGGGVTVAINEICIRTFFAIRQLHAGASLKEAFLPTKSQQKLQAVLLVAHATTTSINLGKVLFTSNPLCINMAQWMVFLKYLGPQLQWMLYGHEELKDTAHNLRWAKVMREAVIEIDQIAMSISPYLHKSPTITI